MTAYTYTAANELAFNKKVLYNENIEKLEENTVYSYDPHGNLYSSIVSVLRPSGAELALSIGAEANAEVTLTQNEYDAWNRLAKTSVTKNGNTSEAAYTYDGDGIRASRSVTADGSTKTVNYLTVGGVVLAQSGDATAAYVRGMGYVAKIGAANDVHYYQYNGHGDVVQVASGASGAVENRYDYDAFGEAVLTVEEVENEVRYSGEFYDAAAGLYYLRARYYDAVTARFTQEDTYRGDATNVSSLNLYAYCYNDPINFVDPSGHSGEGKNKKVVTDIETKLSDDGRFVKVTTTTDSGTKYTKTVRADKYDGGGFVFNGTNGGQTAVDVGDIVIRKCCWQCRWRRQYCFTKDGELQK